MPSPLDVLRAYAADSAEVNDVMRVLASHDRWLAPATLFPDDPPVFDRIVMLSDEIRLPTDQLWLFTDDESAHRFAATYPTLGVLAADLPAERAFSLLTDNYEGLVINPGSPTEERWLAGREAFPLVRMWIDGIAIEKRLARFPDDRAELVERLARFPGISIPVAGDQAVGLPDIGKFKSAAVVFTTSDSGKSFYEKLAPQLRANIRWATGPGRDVCRTLVDQGFDALAFNPAGPGPNPVISIDLARVIAAA